MVGALLGMVLVQVVGATVIYGEFRSFTLFVAVPLLLLAGLVATGRRWAAAVAASITALLVVYTALGAGSRLTELDGGEILAAVLFFGLGLVAVVAGVATTARNRRIG